LRVTFEEGTWAAWLYDLMKPHVTEVLVCNTRKNTSRNGSKSDRIDARKLSEQLYMNNIKSVYHGEHGLRVRAPKNCGRGNPEESWAKQTIRQPLYRVYPDPRTNHTNSLLLDFPGVQSVIPLGAYRMMFSHEFEIFTFDLLSSLINTSVQEGFHLQSCSRARPPNVPQHDFQSLEGLSLPIRADVAEQAMLDRVPL
jgi:hypothetical protein